MEYPKENLDDLDWIKLRNDMDNAIMDPETFWEKSKRKFGENPLIPIGCLFTTSALCYGLYCFSQGNNKMSQRMMRARVMAQGFTIAAFVFGLTAATVKKN